MSLKIALASNQGDIGGGEVMLLQIANAARDLGHEVTIVAPAADDGAPDTVVASARDLGFEAVALPVTSTPGYLRGLRHWATHTRPEVLWCNGLRPSFATCGLPRRIVHLHQIPEGKHALLARAARRGALTTLVPSHFAASRVAGADTLLNWTGAAAATPLGSTEPRAAEASGAPIIGYLGRLSLDKGLDVLVDAVEQLVEGGRDVQLLLAGEARFVDPRVAARVDVALARLGSRVDRRGWMDRDAFFHAVDVAVFPSVWEETFGLVAAEAMAARCTFVVSDAGALPEVAGDGYPYVAPRGDARALADVITAALDTSPEERTKTADRSHDRWQHLYSPEAGRERVARVLDGLHLGGTA